MTDTTPEPTPTVPPSQGSYAASAGTAKPPLKEQAADLQAKALALGQEKPEAFVGAALSGGFVAAFILKRITGGGR